MGRSVRSTLWRGCGGRVPLSTHLDTNGVGDHLYSASVWKRWWCWSALQKSKENLPSGCIWKKMEGHQVRKCDTWKHPIRFWNGPPLNPGGKSGLPKIGYKGDLVVEIAGFLQIRLQTLRVGPKIGCVLSNGGKAWMHQEALQRGTIMNCSNWDHVHWSPCLHQSITRVRWGISGYLVPQIPHTLLFWKKIRKSKKSYYAGSEHHTTWRLPGILWRIKKIAGSVVYTGAYFEGDNVLL